MSGSELQCDLYRYRHPDGSSKDWMIGALETAVHVYFGKTGGSLREIRVPRSQCLNGSPADEMDKRATAQLARGYERVGTAVVHTGDREVIRAEETTVSGLHWETERPVSLTELLAKLREIAKTLGEEPAPGVRLVWDDTGLTLQMGETAWSLGLTPGPYGNVDPNTGRGGGTVLPKHGVVPVLVLLRLAMDFPDAFRFGTDKGETVQLRLDSEAPWFPASLWDRTRKLAVKLKIVAPALSDFEFAPSGIWF